MQLRVPHGYETKEGARKLGPSTGAFGGAPYGATKRCPGWGRRMRTPPLGPSVELPMGPRNAALGGGHESQLVNVHKEFHRRPQWHRPHGGPAPFWHTPHRVRGPTGRSTEGPSGRAHMRDRTQFGTHLTRLVAT